MSQENYAGSVPVSLLAGGTITRNAALKLSAGGVVVTTAITDHVIGVAQQSAVAGEMVPVLSTPGAIVTMVASAAILADAMVMPGAAGKVATAAGVTALTCGQVLDVAAADGDLIRVLFRPGVKSAANA